MKTLILSVALCLALSSCVSTKNAMNAWMGHTERELIMSWGPPAATAPDGGTGKILVYSSQVYVPQYSMNYYDYRMFYIDRHGLVYHWNTQRQQVPPTQIDLNVYRRF